MTSRTVILEAVWLRSNGKGISTDESLNFLSNLKILLPLNTKMFFSRNTLGKQSEFCSLEIDYQLIRKIMSKTFGSIHVKIVDSDTHYISLEALNVSELISRIFIICSFNRFSFTEDGIIWHIFNFIIEKMTAQEIYLYDGSWIGEEDVFYARWLLNKCQNSVRFKSVTSSETLTKQFHGGYLEVFPDFSGREIA